MKTHKSVPVILLLVTLLAPLLLTSCGKSVGETIDDATITTRVKTSLLNDPDVGGLRIDVDTFKGVVTLSGRVKTKDEEAKAVALARKIGGVADVKSDAAGTALGVQRFRGSGFRFSWTLTILRFVSASVLSPSPSASSAPHPPSRWGRRRSRALPDPRPVARAARG